MRETDRPPPASGERPLPRQFIMLLNPDHDIEQRVDRQAFDDFVLAVLSAINGHFSRFDEKPGFDIQVACALLPGGKLLTEIQTCPSQGDTLDSLRERLARLPRPRVSEGPVGFASRELIRGGCPESEVAFAVPFYSLSRPDPSRPLDDILMESGGAIPR